MQKISVIILVSLYNNNNMSTDYYLVPGYLPSSAKMHILTNGRANIGSIDGQLVTNGASTLSLSVNGKVNSGGNIGGSVGTISAPYYSLNPTGDTSGTTIIIPYGSTAQRLPLAYSLPGYLRYNTDSSFSTLEYYRNLQNVYLQLYSPPNVTGITPTTIKLNVGPTIINISGSNFDTSYPMLVIFYRKNYVASYASSTIQILSSASMNVTVPLGVYNGTSASSSSPYTIRVISEFTGMGYTFVDALTVVDGSFSFIAPSTLNTVYTSRSYSRSTFIAGTYGSTANSYGPPPQIIATYEGIPVTNYKFNPASPGYIDVSNNGLSIDASGFITGTIKNGYVTTSQTVSVGVIAGSSSSYDTSSNTNLNIIFRPLLLSFSTSGATSITPVTIYTYAYYQFTNSNVPVVPPTTQLAQYSPPNMPSPATTATYTLTFAASIQGTSVISADPSYSYLDFLILGGGGGGGSGYQGGGGGAGGMVSSGLNSNYTYNYNVGGSGGRLDELGMGPYQVPQGLTGSATISITVGGGAPGGYYNSTGGALNPNNRSGSGGNSSITFPVTNSTTVTYNAYGGGGGSGEQNISTNAGYITGVNYQPLPGGSGGGASHGMQMAYTNYSVNSILLTSSTYDGTSKILTVGATSLSTATGGLSFIGPFLAVYNSTSATPPLTSLIGFIAPFGTSATFGAGGAGTYYLTGLTVPSGGTSYANALASSTSIPTPSTFTVPGGLGGSTTSGLSNNYIYTGIPTGTTYVGNYSLGFSNNSVSGLGLIDALTGYQGNNGGFGVTNNPYVGGGGGGAYIGGGYANNAGNAGVGGNGLENFIKTVNYNTTSPSAGSGTVYGGGGGGSARSGTGGPWAGGTGGGGQGVNTWSTPSNLAGNGTAGLGGGGGSAGGSGGAGTTGQYGGSGGSGTVIIRYRLA